MDEFKYFKPRPHESGYFWNRKYVINLGPGLKENLQIQNGGQQPSFLNFAGAYFQACGMHWDQYSGTPI